MRFIYSTIRTKHCTFLPASDRIIAYRVILQQVLLIKEEEMKVEFVTLNNGVKMPREGFGVFQVPDPAVCK